MTRIFAVYLLISSSILVSGQSSQKYSMVNSFQYMTKLDTRVDHSEFFGRYAEEMGLSKQDDMTMARKQEGVNGYTHYKYTQSYSGIPVYGMSYFLHEKDGEVKTANGLFAPKLNLNTTPTLTAEEALNFAKNQMGAKQYAWESDSKQAMVDKVKPHPELCIIDRALTRVTGHYALVYRIDLYSTVPFDGKQYFVDAHNGNIYRLFLC